MITNALDGSEDHLASSEARGFWDELNMCQKRAKLVREMCGECEAGSVEWAYEVVYQCVTDFEATVVLDSFEDGQKDTGEKPEDQGAGESPWRNEGASDADAQCNLEVRMSRCVHQD